MRTIDLVNSHPIAVKKYLLGEQLQWTHDIGDNPSYGYGKMDFNGFWQYQLYFKEEKVNKNIKGLEIKKFKYDF